jgi:L-arginine dehydrogenase
VTLIDADGRDLEQEPAPRFVQQGAVLRALDLATVREALERAFVSLARGDAKQPGQISTGLPDSAGDAIYYAAAVPEADVFGVTVSPFLEERSRSGLEPVTSYTLLMSTRTGRPLAVLNTGTLIGVRTGATTSVAVSRLAAPDATKLSIIGSGPIARWHLAFTQTIRAWERIEVYSPHLSSPKNEMRRELIRKICPTVHFSASLKECVDGASAIEMCTSAAEPVLFRGDIPAGSLVTSVTTDGPLAHDIEPEFLSLAEVYCDYSPTTPDVAGEMVIAEAMGIWKRDQVLADLPGLVSSETISAAWTRPYRYFRSVGLGIEDVAVAAALAHATAEPSKIEALGAPDDHPYT